MKKTVECKVIFTRMGTIDTISENFNCQAYIETSWEDDDLFDKVLNKMDIDLRFKDVEDLNSFLSKQLKAFRFDSKKDWSPLIYIENAIGDLKEEKKYKLEITEKKFNAKEENKNVDNVVRYRKYTLKVHEMWYVEGVFYERLELNDFPMDLQELTLKISTKYPDTMVKLIENQSEPCSISTEIFLNQQEWDLFDYVKTSKLTVADAFKNYNRCVFSVTSFIARKPEYYYNNAYMLIFIITVLGFVPFSVVPTSPSARMSVAGIFILTQVNFRWIITQRIPSVAYLTSIDKYAIGNLFFLTLFAFWHAIIGSTCFQSFSADYISQIDMIACITFGVAFVIYNLAAILELVRMQIRTKKIKNINKNH